MTLIPYWELNVFAWLLVLLIGLMVVVAVWEWWQRERVFRGIARHMGTTYDASVKARPNLRIGERL